MDSKDREAIEGLFQKLQAVEGSAAARDAEAERFIAERIGRQPGAPYYMAQTVVMQEQALNAQAGEIASLRRRLASQGEEAERPGEAAGTGGGLLSRVFGTGQPRRTGSVPSVPRREGGGVWGSTAGGAGERDGYAPGGSFGQRSGGFGGGGGLGGGGFLAGAAQTAMGVAGGVLLGNALGGLFSGNEAEAASAADGAAPQDDAAGADTPADAATPADYDGGDAGGDVGGDFGMDDI